MKNILRIVFLLIGLCLYTESFGQCQQLYDAGVKLMNTKKWSQAKAKFSAAKICDSKLSLMCDKNIAICNQHISDKDDNTSGNKPKGKGKNKKDKPQTDESHNLNITPASLSFDNRSVSKFIYIDSKIKGKNAEWTYTVKNDDDNAWLHCKENEGKLQVWCSSNTSFLQRTGYVTIKNSIDEKIVKIVQQAYDTLYVESDDGNPTNVSFKLKGGHKTIRVVCPDNDFNIISQPNQSSLTINRDGAYLTINATKASNNWDGNIVIQSKSGKTVVIDISQHKKILGINNPLK